MDITKCLGQIGAIDCPYKEKCYRFTAKGDELYQSYFMELPLKDDKCDHYWGDGGLAIWSPESIEKETL
jgi:hypothetical protein